jgi:hypothetical protein
LYNIKILQYYNITILQYYNITILQYYNITMLCTIDKPRIVKVTKVRVEQSAFLGLPTCYTLIWIRIDSFKYPTLCGGHRIGMLLLLRYEGIDFAHPAVPTDKTLSSPLGPIL